MDWKEVTFTPVRTGGAECLRTLMTGSGRVPVVLRNNTKDWLEIKKGTPIARMVAANLVPRVINAISAKGPDPASTLTEAERQDLLLDKLDLSGLEEWPTEQAEKARGLLKEYHDIFFLEKQDMGHTKAAEHKMFLRTRIPLHSRSGSIGSLLHNWTRCETT